jgi:hypothetical protein
MQGARRRTGLVEPGSLSPVSVLIVFASYVLSTCDDTIKTRCGQTRWLMPVIPATLEAEAGRSMVLRPAHTKLVRPYLKTKYKPKSWAIATVVVSSILHPRFNAE